MNGQICRVAGGSASMYADFVKKALADAGKSRLAEGKRFCQSEKLSKFKGSVLRLKQQNA